MPERELPSPEGKRPRGVGRSVGGIFILFRSSFPSLHLRTSLAHLVGATYKHVVHNSRHRRDDFLALQGESKMVFAARILLQ